MTARVYPLPRPEDDPRFTYGLHFDVAAVLEAHGYPQPTGPDFVELGQVLFRFLYAATTEQRPADEADYPYPLPA